MHIEYIGGPPTDAHECAVIDAGYRWVRTNTIAPNGGLAMHGHSGPNTHLIVKGSLQFENSAGKSKYSRSREDVAENPNLTKNVLDEADPSARKELHVPGHNFYKAISSQGATFVEGHRSLSPQTAERFIDRGTLRIVPNEGTMAWPEQAVLQKLLRDAKWFPRGEQGLSNTLKPMMRWESCHEGTNTGSKGFPSNLEDKGPVMHAPTPVHWHTHSMAPRNIVEDNCAETGGEPEADPWRAHRMTTRSITKMESIVYDAALSHNELGIANAKDQMRRFFIAEWEQMRPEPQPVDHSDLYQNHTVTKPTDEEKTDCDESSAADEMEIYDYLKGLLGGNDDLASEVLAGYDDKVSAAQYFDGTAALEDSTSERDASVDALLSCEGKSDAARRRRASSPMVKSSVEALMDCFPEWCDEDVGIVMW